MMIRLLILSIVVTTADTLISSEPTSPSVKKLVTLKPFEKKGYTEILVDLRNRGIASMEEFMPVIIEEIKRRTEGRFRTFSRATATNTRTRSRKSVGAGSAYRVHIDLGSNKLKKIDSGLFNTLDAAGYSLYALHLDSNLLNTFPHEIVTTCDQLAILTLSNNQIATFNDKLTMNTTHLAYLDITRNNLSLHDKELIRHAIHPNCMIVADDTNYATSTPKNGRQHRASSSDSAL